jgi:large subunit ribosomal protein L24
MKSTFSRTWNSSVQRRKQRKFSYNAPHHIKGKFLSAHLSPVLREKYSTRSLRLKKGDKVKILRGSSKGKEGTIERVDLQKTRVYINKMERTKVEGAKAQLVFHPSSLMIIELNLSDKKRKAKLEAKNKE